MTYVGIDLSRYHGVEKLSALSRLVATYVRVDEVGESVHVRCESMVQSVHEALPSLHSVGASC